MDEIDKLMNAALMASVEIVEDPEMVKLREENKQLRQVLSDTTTSLISCWAYAKNHVPDWNVDATIKRATDQINKAS